ncbi:MAG TPA: SpoIIE family protein phosphatase [Anaerolineales bacterium]|nr:SpoIIE family protein phosphatase [Anaerolineales bacterium]
MDFLERFASSLSVSDTAVLAARNYIEWQIQRHTADFFPSADDDVDLRTYLFHLYTKGADRAALEEQVSALKRYYQWAQTKGVITHNPFDEYNFGDPFLTSVQIDPRPQTLPKDLNEREVERLRALSQIAEQLNGSVDIQSALDNTLRTLLKVMNLQTGWVSMLAESHLSVYPAGDPPPHGFVLATACGLPPGLEGDDRRFLRQPPACHCQHLLIEGRLTRAVNIVECTRLRDSTHAAGNNQGLLFHASVPLISQGKPLGLINVATPEWRFLTHADLHFLSAVSAQLVVALERAHFYEVAEARRTRLENELQVAREIQAGLMAREMPDIPGFGLAGAWRPARAVAGDFYDIFPLDEGRWGMVIGDVADKGTAAALYMAVIHSLILSGALRHGSPAAVLMEVNQTILRQFTSGMFVTVFLAVLDPKQQTLQYANAGHNPPIVRRASGTIESLTRTGCVVGVLEEVQLSETTITLGSGDAVVLYTDGVTEALNSRDEDYGINRLTTAIAAAPRKAGELLAHVEADLNAFTEGTPQQDDVTFLVLTRD